MVESDRNDVIDSSLLVEKFTDLRKMMFAKTGEERDINEVLFLDEFDKLPEDEEKLKRKELLWDEFEKLTAELSSILPTIPDTSIFEIEDLLFLDISQPTVTSEIKFTGELNDLIEQFQSLYDMYPRTNKKFRARVPEKKFIFVAYLQLLLISEDYYFIKHVITIINVSLGKKPLDVCLGIILMKIILKKGIPFIDRKITIDQSIKMFSVMLWKNLPEGNNEEQRRILKWLKYQASIIQPEYIKLKYFTDQKHIVTIIENPPEEGSLDEYIKQTFFCKSYKGVSFFHYQNDNLYNFFMSANTTEQRRDRMERFIKGCFEATKKWGKKRFERYNQELKSSCYLDENEANLEEIPFRLRFSILISKLIENLDTFVGLRSIWFSDSDKHKIDDMCRHIDKYHSHKIDPYIPESATDNSMDLSKKGDVEQIPDLNKMENSSDMPDYSFEKHFIYDQFMRRIHVLNIIITAYRHCSEFLKSQGIKESDEVFIFRRRNTEYTRYFKENTCDVYTIPWHLEMILTKCPFLFFPKIHEHLADKLLKYHKGEHVDEGEVEELLFVLNTFEG